MAQTAAPHHPEYDGYPLRTGARRSARLLFVETKYLGRITAPASRRSVSSMAAHLPRVTTKPQGASADANTPDPTYHGGGVRAEAAKPLAPIAYILRLSRLVCCSTFVAAMHRLLSTPSSTAIMAVETLPFFWRIERHRNASSCAAGSSKQAAGSPSVIHLRFKGPRRRRALTYLKATRHGRLGGLGSVFEIKGVGTPGGLQMSATRRCQHPVITSPNIVTSALLGRHPSATAPRPAAHGPRSKSHSWGPDDYSGCRSGSPYRRRLPPISRARAR